MILAHVDRLNGDRQETLHEHIVQTMAYAREFGRAFNAGELASLVASVHDFGKCSAEFQNYIRMASRGCDESLEEEKGRNCRHKGPDHSSAGAQYLGENQDIQGIGLLLAYAVAGHHAGLPDGMDNSNAALANRLKKSVPQWEDAAREFLPASFFQMRRDELAGEIKPFLKSGSGYSAFFLVRMLFSCLVDADFLATEKFMDDEKSNARMTVSRVGLDVLRARLEKHYETLVVRAGKRISRVNQIRNEVREDCLTAAEMEAGLFTLTVPTGGGKTLASMAFALKHALKHGMKRIVYVIPYTSIIEQNAHVFREVFGDDAVLEHHCNFDFEGGGLRAKLASENWDAPIVVTTSVQFFESLHANRASRCRKLHNLAEAVIVLDEAQSLPVDLLQPCLRALKELMVHYRSSVVLCTATQPAVMEDQIKRGGLSNSREIISKNRNLHDRLKRVRVERMEGEISDDELVAHLRDYPSCLVIVGTRRHAREIFERMQACFGSDGIYHLSAQMCPEHRTGILNKIRAHLAKGEPCRVVSTQLVEAGVDIDFPCVFRELAGVDSMAQAAGRCNREGKLDGLGRVFLFEGKDRLPPPGFLRVAAQTGKETIGLPYFQDDPIGPDATLKYFELLYESQKHALDKFGVLTELMPNGFDGTKDFLLSCRFKTLGERFRLIDDNTVSVFVPYGPEGVELCEDLRSAYAPGEQRRLARKLQRYAVSIHGKEPVDSSGHPIAEKVHDVYWILTNTDLSYDEKLGINFKGNDSFPSIL